MEQSNQANPALVGAAPLRIVLVEDHTDLRQGLAALLAMDRSLEMAGEAGSASEALSLIASAQPAVIVCDISLPDRSGIDLVADLRASGNLTPVLMLTVDRSEEHIRAAFRAGATGYLLKESSHAELLQGIRSVSLGRRFLCNSASSTVLSCFVDLAAANLDHSPETSITGREREVLTRIALGQSNKHAARALGLSVKTVEKHRSNLMRKLNLHNTAALTMFAIRYGLVNKDLTAAG